MSEHVLPPRYRNRDNSQLPPRISQRSGQVGCGQLVGSSGGGAGEPSNSEDAGEPISSCVTAAEPMRGDVAGREPAAGRHGSRVGGGAMSVWSNVAGEAAGAKWFSRISIRAGLLSGPSSGEPVLGLYCWVPKTWRRPVAIAAAAATPGPTSAGEAAARVTGEADLSGVSALPYVARRPIAMLAAAVASAPAVARSGEAAILSGGEAAVPYVARSSTASRAASFMSGFGMFSDQLSSQ